jgi:hypothetical protein
MRFVLRLTVLVFILAAGTSGALAAVGPGPVPPNGPGSDLYWR